MEVEVTPLVELGGYTMSELKLELTVLDEQQVEVYSIPLHTEGMNKQEKLSVIRNDDPRTQYENWLTNQVGAPNIAEESAEAIRQNMRTKLQGHLQDLDNHIQEARRKGLAVRWELA